MCMQYALHRFLDKFNINSLPNVTIISKKELIEKAWEDTGQHLQKALDINAKIIKDQSTSGSSK